MCTEILSDVVHVAEHRREHDGSFRRALGSLEELLEVCDGSLHHFGRLQDERQNKLSTAEAVADVLHRRQEDLVEHLDGRARQQCFIDRLLDTVLTPSQDRLMDPLFHGDVLRRRVR